MFFFIILLILPIPNAFSAVTLNGTTLTLDNSTVSINSPITVDQVRVEGDGFSTRLTDSDPLRKYTIYRNTTQATSNWSWIDIGSLFTNFTRVTGGVTDANVNITGSELFQTNIDGDTSGTWDFADSLNHVFVGAGAIVQLIWQAIVPPPVATGGGASSGTLQGINIEIQTVRHFLPVNQLQDGQLIVKWDSGEDLVINSVVLQNNPFQFTFQNLPVRLLGSGGDESKGLILYTVQSPSIICTGTVLTTNCVTQDIFLNNFDLEATFLGGSVTTSGQIVVDTRIGDLTDYYWLLLLFIAIIISAWIIGLERKKRQKRKPAKPQKSSKRLTLSVLSFIGFLGLLLYLIYAGIIEQTMEGILLGAIGVLALFGLIALFVVILHGSKSKKSKNKITKTLQKTASHRRELKPIKVEHRKRNLTKELKKTRR